MSDAQYVTLETSVGPFTVELYTKHAPKVRPWAAVRYEAS